jgi:hypothetical protein
MKNNSYNATILVSQKAEEVFNAICNVRKWWSKDFNGSSVKLNDEFSIDHPGQHYSKQKLVEFIPHRKIVWLVTESKMNWLKGDQDEWTNTKMDFEISAEGGRTKLHFSHQGLTPEKECYCMCGKGWDIVIKDWLTHFIVTGKSSTDMDRAAEIRNQHFDVS